MKPKILIIDDDREFIDDFMLLLGKDFFCDFEITGESGINALKEKDPDVVLLDLMLGNGSNGIDVLKSIMNYDEDIPVIMITDYASIDTAVEAIRLGAFDYISKTPNLKELKVIIEKSMSQRNLKFRARSFEQELNKPYKNIIGRSEKIKNVEEKIELYAGNDSTVLITGESGVGKELVARQIHLRSGRKKNPFIPVNCAAIPKELFESELFGYEKGAFTGADKRKPGKVELAMNGTLFLDEIGELDIKGQVKFLRLLQEKEFERVGGTAPIKANVRIIAATNRNLKELVIAKQFREDLFYRLDVLPVFIPPLRERAEDIPPLIEHYTKLICAELKVPFKKFSEDAVSLMTQYSWPGNVRELQNYLTRIILLSVKDNIEAAEIDLYSEGETKKVLPAGAPVPQTWEEMDKMRTEAADLAARRIEKIFLENLLAKFDWNITKAAEHIGMNRSNLHKMIKKCGIENGD